MNQKQRLNNKVVVITGAASGFGAAMARLFHQEGAQIVVADLNEAAGTDIATELDGVFVRCNVAQGSDVQALADVVDKRFGKLDVLVNNAGVAYNAKPSVEVTEAEFDRVFDINVKSLFHMNRSMVPLLKRSSGAAIVNIASITGVRPGPGLLWYGATKSAMIGITKGLAQELAPAKIRVNCINPMLGETPLLTTFMGGEDSAQGRERFMARIPLGRLTTPQDVAYAALYLASDEASFLTGVSLDVDGGRNI